MINVLFFASLREKLNCESVSLSLGRTDELATDISTVADVKARLIELHPDWQVHFRNSALLNAVNQQMADNSCRISDGDEVAFFPPVTGG